VQSIPLQFSGMDNKARPEALPKDKLRNAVNVIFDDDGNIQFPRPGKTIRYAGNCHSVYENKFNTLFVEDGALKRLNNDNTATSLLSTWGNSRTFYTIVGDIIYCSNDGYASGKVHNGIASEWGTARPPRQPDCFPIATGDMYAGDYRVAITWIADEESGTGMGKRVTVQDGGGIRVTNLPVPPAYVTGFAIWVSSVNSKDMYLYGEYGIDIAEVHIGRLTADGVLPTVPLTTQFGFEVTNSTLRSLTVTACRSQTTTSLSILKCKRLIRVRMYSMLELRINSARLPISMQMMVRHQYSSLCRIVEQQEVRKHTTRTA